MFKAKVIIITAFLCTMVYGCGNSEHTNDNTVPYNSATEYYARGWEYYKAAEYQRAYSQFKKAVELNNDYPEACLGLAYCYKWFADAAIGENNLKRVEHNDKWAAAYFSRAIELRPDYYDAYIGLGSLYTDRGWYEASLKPLEIAQHTAPERFEAYLYLGRAYTHLGEAAEKEGQSAKAAEYYAKAVNSLKKYLELFRIDPKSDEIRELIEILQNRLNSISK